MIVISFGHRLQQGKDTSIRAIQAAFGSKAMLVRYGFGDLVRQEVSDYIPELPPHTQRFCIENFPRGWDSGSSSYLDSLLYRRVLQFHGAWRRSTDEFYWIRKMSALICADYPTVTFISGVRFPNEVGWVRSQGGIYVKVIRHGYKPPSSVANDPTETALDGEEPDAILEADDGDIRGLGERAVTWFLGYLFTLDLNSPQNKLPLAMVKAIKEKIQ
jgi:hypothetical protein